MKAGCLMREETRLAPAVHNQAPLTESYAGSFRSLSILAGVFPNTILRWLIASLILIWAGGGCVVSGNPPVLITESTSTRAIALESVNFTREPFMALSSSPWNADHQTRVILFALNLPTGSGVDNSLVSADAEDATHQHYSLTVECVVPVPSFQGLSEVVVKLSDSMGNAGDLLVRITYGGANSNRVRIGVGHVGSGPPDDPGAGPALIPPYVISGYVRLAGAGFSGVSVTLAGGEAQTTTTDNSGFYSFQVTTAGNDYAISFAKAFYEFNPKVCTVQMLTSNQSIGDSGANRQLLSISGFVQDDEGQPLNTVVVTLLNETGSPVANTTTAAGSFTFSNIPAGYNYTLRAAPNNFFTFADQTTGVLAANTTVSVTGVRRSYSIRGRVVDATGHGLGNVIVSLNDSQTLTGMTDINGNYLLTGVPAGRSYSVKPQIDQDDYVFSPAASSINNLDTDQTRDFTGALAPIPDPGYVLEFDGSPKTVFSGYFWDPYVNLGHFFWEFWAMPGNNAGATYMVSDGYGGAHALLFGVASFNSYESGRYILLGNIFDGVLDISHVTYFGSDQGPAPGEWAHMAVGWDGRNIITYLNGVPVGKTAFAGPRQTPGPGQGGSWLLIGGSDHSNFDGRIAQVRGYENSNPRENPVNPASVETTFAPQTVFGVDGNFLNYYFRPASHIADISRGYNSTLHRGTPRGTTAGILYDCGSCPPPQFVIDPTAPNFAGGTAPAPVGVPAPPAVPPQAMVFDSFSRANSTYTFGGPGGLGSTEGGTAGLKTWLANAASSGPQPFGILNGRGVLLSNDTCVTWVPTGSSTGNLDLRVDRHAGIFGSGLDTGLSFRVADPQNYFFAYTSGTDQPASSRTLTVGYYLNGHRTDIAAGVSMPANWTALRVVTTSDGNIAVYADASLVYSGASDVLSSATGAGLYNDSAGLGLVNRWDNFTVFAAPPPGSLIQQHQ